MSTNNKLSKIFKELEISVKKTCSTLEKQIKTKNNALTILNEASKDIDKQLSDDQITQANAAIQKEIQLAQRGLQFFKQQNNIIQKHKNTNKNKTFSTEAKTVDKHDIISSINNNTTKFVTEINAIKSLEEINNAYKIINELKKYYKKDIKQEKQKNKLRKATNSITSTIKKGISKIKSKIKQNIKTTKKLAGIVKNSLKNEIQKSDKINQQMEKESKQNRKVVQKAVQKSQNTIQKNNTTNQPMEDPHNHIPVTKTQRGIFSKITNDITSGIKQNIKTTKKLAGMVKNSLKNEIQKSDKINQQMEKESKQNRKVVQKAVQKSQNTIQKNNTTNQPMEDPNNQIPVTKTQRGIFSKITNDITSGIKQNIKTTKKLAGIVKNIFKKPPTAHDILLQQSKKPSTQNDTIVKKALSTSHNTELTNEIPESNKTNQPMKNQGNEIKVIKVQKGMLSKITNDIKTVVNGVKDMFKNPENAHNIAFQKTKKTSKQNNKTIQKINKNNQPEANQTANVQSTQPFTPSPTPTNKTQSPINKLPQK